jgi:hypothetical protein
MKGAGRWLIPLLPIPLLALLAFGLTRSPQVLPSAIIGETAPDFTLQRMEGDSLTLSELRGINLLVYLLPALAVLLGGGALFWLMRRWTGNAGPGEVAPEKPAAEPPEEGLSEEEEAWLRQQIGSVR